MIAELFLVILVALLKEICGYTLKRILPVPAVITTECEEKQKKQERKQYNSKREPIHNTFKRKRLLVSAPPPTERPKTTDKQCASFIKTSPRKICSRKSLLKTNSCFILPRG